MVWKGNKVNRFQEVQHVVERLGVFRARELASNGFPRIYITRLLKDGFVEKLGRGLYVRAGYSSDRHKTLLEVSKRFPRGVICLTSALQFHEIGTQIPYQVWMALPRTTNFPTSTKLPVRLFKFSQKAFSFGIQKREVSGGEIQVYSPAKTIADCFKYRNKIGLEVAIEALHEGWKQRKFTIDELMSAAEACSVKKAIQPYLEMLTHA